MRSSGSITTPGADRRARRARVERLAVELDDAGRRPVGAEDRPGDLGAAAADQARKPDDLAGADLEARRPATAVGRASPRTESTTGASAAGGALSGNVRSSGRPSMAVTRRSGVSRGGGRRLHELPVAQHGHRVGERQHLGQEVRHVDDRRAPLAKAR